MESILKSDIFFFITSIAVICITLVSLLILFYFIKAARHIEYIAKRIRNGSDIIADDMAEIRAAFKEKAAKAPGLFGSALGFVASIIGQSLRKQGKSTQSKTAKSSRKKDASHKARSAKTGRETNRETSRDMDDENLEDDSFETENE